MKTGFTQNILYKLYIEERKTPYEIATLFKCDHKTVRKYLKQHDIPLRTASEYNYAARCSHTNPSKELLLSALSIAAHTAYLCEGWHTDKTSNFNFSNTDPNLIDIEISCLQKIYTAKTIRITITSPDKQSAKDFTRFYPTAKFYIDKSRKNPIIRLFSGGKTLARDFIKNAYDILYSLD